MNCPVCKVPLMMAEKQGVEIDYCPQCRGIWLDRGELEKIIERSASFENPQQAVYDKHAYGKHDDHHSSHGYNKHHKKGFLGNLFDF